MMAIFWFILSLALIDFTVTTGFLALVTAKRVVAEKRHMPPVVLAVARFWLVVGVPADFLFNAYRGSIMFREWPQWHKKEFMFSSRVERWANVHISARTFVFVQRAMAWASFLNVDPGHIDLDELEQP